MRSEVVLTTYPKPLYERKAFYEPILEKRLEQQIKAAEKSLDRLKVED